MFYKDRVKVFMYIRGCTGQNLTMGETRNKPRKEQAD